MRSPSIIFPSIIFPTLYDEYIHVVDCSELNLQSLWVCRCIILCLVYTQNGCIYMYILTYGCPESRRGLLSYFVYY